MAGLAAVYASLAVLGFGGSRRHNPCFRTVTYGFSINQNFTLMAKKSENWGETPPWCPSLDPSPALI
jgi:hypothetical protein